VGFAWQLIEMATKYDMNRIVRTITVKLLIHPCRFLFGSAQ
jgi:hypothetical protein